MMGNLFFNSILGHLSSPFSAGVFCAIVSHPADSVVSVLNKEKGSSASLVLRRLGFKGRIFFFLFKKEHFLGTYPFLKFMFHISTRCMEGTLCPYHHDWHFDCTTVVHLWLCEGVSQAPSPSSSWDAGVSEEEAWINSVDQSKCGLILLVDQCCGRIKGTFIYLTV